MKSRKLPEGWKQDEDDYHRSFGKLELYVGYRMVSGTYFIVLKVPGDNSEIHTFQEHFQLLSDETISYMLNRFTKETKASKLGEVIFFMRLNYHGKTDDSCEKVGIASAWN